MDALPRAIVLLLLVVTVDIHMSSSSFCAAFIFQSATTNNNSIVSNVKTSKGGCRAESRIIKKNVNNFIAGQSNNCQFMTPPSSSSDDTNNNDAEQLQEAAAKLREEAQAAEELLSSSRSKLVIEDVKPPVEYIDVKDSCWEITYRFANEPLNNNDDDDDKDKVPRKSYGGKLQIRLRGDGYTDIIQSASSGNDDNINAASFTKVWGWDIETSSEDQLDYILFSADVRLPPPISTEERCYFQARVDKEGPNKDILALNDGSVTLKRNVKAPGGGQFGWGLFKGAESILAVFRDVGEFRCKSLQDPNM